jgi:hypothetical protein
LKILEQLVDYLAQRGALTLDFKPPYGRVIQIEG